MKKRKKRTPVPQSPHLAWSTLSEDCLRRRVQSLDDAFLFVIGLTTVVFAILQTVLGGKDALLLFTPLLASGLAYPFYIGYVRGTVLFDDRREILERARGWVCFAVSVFLYLYSIEVIIARDFVPQLSGYNLPLGLTIIIIGMLVSRKLARWYFVSTGYLHSPSDILLLGASAGGASLLSIVTIFIEEYLRLWIDQVRSIQPPYLPNLAPIVLMLPAFIIVERVIQEITQSNSKLQANSEYRVSTPWYAVALGYLLTGTLRCVWLGLRSDRKAAVAYLLSYILILVSINRTIVGTVSGLVAILLMAVTCWKFLKCNFGRRNIA